MKEIQLTRGQIALVDDEDFEALNKYKWYAWKDPKRDFYYAARNVVKPNGRRTTLKMHVQIAGKKGQDHQDGNGINNQRYNLRPATPKQNGANSAKKVRKVPATSQYKGVSKRKGLDLWRAQLWDGKTVNIGYFVHEIDAAKAYDAKAVEHFGEFARLNFPLGT